MKASHDSLTSYPLKTWWLYPFLFTAKTQTKTIEEQLNSGVKYLDLRFRNINGELYGAHGFMIFNITAHEVFNILINWCVINRTIVYFRVLLEDGLSKDDISLDDFEEKINGYIELFPNTLKLHFIGKKSDWNNIRYKMDIPYYGKNNFTLFNIKDKIKEMKEFNKEELHIYECYTYKGIPIPWFYSKIIDKYIPYDSMKNFV